MKTTSWLALFALIGIAAPAAEALAFDRWFRHELADPYAYRDPSLPWAKREPTYRSVTSDLRSYRPVDPLPWDEINRRVAPQPKEPSNPKKTE